MVITIGAKREQKEGAGKRKEKKRRYNCEGEGR